MTPETATSWLDLVNTGGTIFVLAAIVVYGVRMLPAFMKRWGEHTEALVNVANELQGIKDEVKELRYELDKRNPQA